MLEPTDQMDNDPADDEVIIIGRRSTREVDTERLNADMGAVIAYGAERRQQVNKIRLKTCPEPTGKPDSKDESRLSSLKRSSNSKFKKPMAITSSYVASYTEETRSSAKFKPGKKLAKLVNQVIIRNELTEPLDERKWPADSIRMERDANEVRNRSLVASQLVRMGYSNDRKAIGDVIRETDPNAKVPRFKVYGKNQTAD